MFTVSLCMIVKNEEETLGRCLSSVRDAVDEIIIADTGSSDSTKEIAARFTDKIFDFAWVDDFSAARNFSFSKAVMDYILWLDADDVLLQEDAEKLKEMKRSMAPDFNVAMMKYNTGFDEKGRVNFSFFRERLLKRDRGFKWVEPVHEYIQTWGDHINSDICVTHMKPETRNSGGNIRIYESVLKKGGKLSPRGTYYYARELKDNGRFADAAAYFTEFLDDGLGWAEDNITACGELANCLLAQNRQKEALAAMFKSFEYDVPRPEICCQIGYYFKQMNDFKKAAFWFSLILSLDKEEDIWSFRLEDCEGYIPCIELAVCLHNLGEYEKAAQYNEMAAKYKPDSKAVLENREYFLKLLKKETNT